MPEFFYDERGRVAIEFESHAENSSSTSSYTFSGQAFGAAEDNRYIVVALSWIIANTISSVTIGGVTATILVEATTTGRGCALCIALVPTGTSGDIVLNLSGGSSGATCAVYKVTGIQSAAAASTASSAASAPTASLNIAANGGLIAVAQAQNFSAPTASWTNATEDCENTYSTVQTRTTASATNENEVSGLDVTATFSGTLVSLGVFATFEP